MGNFGVGVYLCMIHPIYIYTTPGPQLYIFLLFEDPRVTPNRVTATDSRDTPLEPVRNPPALTSARCGNPVDNFFVKGRKEGDLTWVWDRCLVFIPRRSRSEG